MPSSYYPSERLPSEPSYSADVFRHDLTKQRPSLGGHMNGRDDATVVHGFTSSSSEAGVTPIGDPHRGLFDDSEFHSPNAEMPSFEPSWWTAPTCVGDHTSFQEATDRYERRLAATPLPVPAFDCASGEASIQKKAPPDIHAPDTHPLMEHYAPGTECTLQIKQRPYGNTKHCSHKPKCGSSTTRGSPPEIGCGSNKAKKTSRDDVILGIPASSALDSDFSMELAASNGWLQQAYQDEELEQSRQGKKFNVRFEVLGCGSHENSKQYNEWSAGNTALDYFNWKHLDPSPRVLGPLTKFELAQRVAVELREYMERQASHENHLMHGLRQVELDHILIVKVVYPTKASAQPVLGILPEYQALYV
ncbi:hypothetical protein FKP32DRAFT_1680367 [Trametes sanguinea]|nr:hypothetical protein FKP32DRAFT_1680367 [Trametes sanguinea]